MKYSSLKNAEHTVYVDEYDKDGKKVFVMYLLLTVYSVSFSDGNYSYNACYSIVSTEKKSIPTFFFGCSLENKLKCLGLGANLEAPHFRENLKRFKAFRAGIQI